MKLYKRKLVFSYKKMTAITMNAVIIFALIKPDSLEYLGFGWLEYILVGLDGLLFLYLLIKRARNEYVISEISRIVILYFVIGLLPTILYSHELFVWIKTAGPAMAACLLTDYMVRKNPEIFFQSIFITLGTCYTLNLLSIIYYPDGMYRMDTVTGDLYLMGYHNGMIYNLIPLCGVSFILSYIKKRKLWTGYSLYAVTLSMISEFMAVSGSGMVQIVILTLLLFFIDNHWARRYIKPSIFYILFFGFSMLFCMFRLQYMFSWLIVDVLHKNLTLTNRVYLWDSAIRNFIAHPLIGCGYGTKTIVGIYNRTYSHPHSLFLDILSRGGIVLMGIFALLLYVFEKKYRDAKNDMMRSVILIVIGSFLIGEVVNSIQYKIFFWMFFVLIGYVDHIVET